MSMKRFLVYIVLVASVLWVACEKDSPIDKNNGPSTSELTTIQVDELRNLVPIELFKAHSKCIFINAEGEKLELNINLVETYVDKIIDGIMYQAESISFAYGDPNHNAYVLTIEATGNYTKDVHSQSKFVLCQSLASINQGYTAFVIIDSNGVPQFTARHVSSELLLDRAFEDVYYNLGSSSILHFSRIYYSPSMGVIAFYGFDNELWVLESFK